MSFLWSRGQSKTMSSVSSNRGQLDSLSLSLSFMTLTLLKNTGEFCCRWPSILIVQYLHMVRWSFSCLARVPKKWCVPFFMRHIRRDMVLTYLITILSFLHKELTPMMLVHHAPDLIHRLQPCSTLQSNLADTQLWPGFSQPHSIRVPGPSCTPCTPKMPERSSLAALSLSVFRVGFISFYPYRSSWEEMTALCVVLRPRRW